jgi:hypothetical protein
MPTPAGCAHQHGVSPKQYILPLRIYGLSVDVQETTRPGFPAFDPERREEGALG